MVTARSDDTALPAAQRPSTRPGLNRYVWDMKHPGPVKIDTPLVSRSNKPLAIEPQGQTGPLTVPGDYRVELTVESKTLAADFSIVKDRAWRGRRRPMRANSPCCTN